MSEPLIFDTTSLYRILHLREEDCLLIQIDKPHVAIGYKGYGCITLCKKTKFELDPSDLVIESSP